MKLNTIKLRTYLFLLLSASLAAIIWLYHANSPTQIADLPVPELAGVRYMYSIYGAKGVKIVRPMAVFVDATTRRIYVANTEGHQVDVFKDQGEYLFSFGSFGADPGQLSYPYGIARMNNGDILVAEAGNRRVQRFSPQGQYLGTLFSQPNRYKIEKPGPLYIDHRGRIYVGDLSGNKVVVLDEQGNVVRQIEGVVYPHGIAVDEDSEILYVAASGTREIREYNLKREDNAPERIITGMREGQQAQSFGLIRGLAVDKTGNLFVVDSILGQIRVFDAAGVYQYSFGSSGNGDGQLLYPNGIFVDDSKRVYVADWANNRVVVWSY